MYKRQIQCCVKLQDSAKETFNNLKQAYGDESMSRAQGWDKAFLDGRETMEDEHHSGEPSTAQTDENVLKVRDLIKSDQSDEWHTKDSPHPKKSTICNGYL